MRFASVDSQCHASPVWYEPVEALLEQMTRHGVAQAVLIQMLGQFDNGYQQECLKRFPGRFASVVMVDPNEPRALTLLQRLAEEGASGVRLRPTARSPGPDPLAIWRCAQECRLAVSCVGNAATFSSPEFSQLVSELPNLPIVLEHLGGTSQPDLDESSQALRLRVMGLARFPNVYLKVPGLGELLARKSPPPGTGNPFEPGTPAILQEAVRAFGAHRLMWGSDFPPVCSREGYGNALTLSREVLADLPSADLDEIFGGVARRIFRIPVPDSP
jgi:predicted TIM-barrel fold metal-dependent hydrolase